MLNQLSIIFGIPIWAIVLVLIWTAVWKGIALWKSARKNHLIWFIAVLVVNTMGILEILYIFLFSEIRLDSKKKTAGKKRIVK